MPSDTEAKILEIARCLKTSRLVVVLSGAGISKESGIPTFRDAQTGMWANYDPQKLATPEGFCSDPVLVWQWYEWRRKMVSEVKPNAGHYALSALDQLVNKIVVVTQNVDGLHAKAGSKNIIELHGSIMRHTCFDKHHKQDPVPFGLTEPPKCHCGSLVRPDVVWFGEPLPQDAYAQAVNMAKSCDLLFSIGTSGLVYPAASLPFIAKEEGGALLVEINPEETPLTDIADLFLAGPSGQLLPEIISAMKLA